MTKGYVIAIVIVVVLVGGGLVYWYSSMQNPSPAPVTSVQSTSTPVAPVTTSVASTSAPATVTTVTYTGSGFSPATVTIPQGGTVIFKNAGTVGVWVASDPHPLHNGYPTTGGCIGSTFDSCKSVLPGESFTFNFTFAGSWGYHNHMNPGQRGTVVVQ